MDDLEQSRDVAEKAAFRRELPATTSHIDEAKGIVLLLCATTAQNAFARLSVAAMTRNVTMTNLAAAVVDVAATPSPVFTRSVPLSHEHIVALELLEEWGMDFGPALAGMARSSTTGRVLRREP